VTLDTKGLGDPATDVGKIVWMAWESLPAAHRDLLESIGASQWRVVDEPLGTVADGFLRSAGQLGLTGGAQRELDRALGLWLRDLRIVLINEGHPKLAGLSAQTREEFISRVAWHEWGHALSIARCTQGDVAAGSRLLELAPEGIQRRIRQAGYPPRNHTHEVIAETYALLMVRRLAGRMGQPSWLDDQIYDLLKRVTDWGD
jgi:hypothetical protein